MYKKMLYKNMSKITHNVTYSLHSQITSLSCGTTSTISSFVSFYAGRRQNHSTSFFAEWCQISIETSAICQTTSSITENVTYQICIMTSKPHKTSHIYRKMSTITQNITIRRQTSFKTSLICKTTSKHTYNVTYLYYDVQQ